MNLIWNTGYHDRFVVFLLNEKNCFLEAINAVHIFLLTNISFLLTFISEVYFILFFLYMLIP